MKTYAEMVFPVVLTLGVGVMLVSSLLESSWITKFVPIVIAIPTMFLGIAVIVRDFKRGIVTEKVAATSVKEFFQANIQTISLLALVLAVYLLGFLVGTALFLLFYLKFVGKESWWLSIVISLCTIAAIYGIFAKAFSMRLFAGILFM
ncbi:MAG: tripartite tricarboxylate transporter TctB family protein [Bacillota bacterium]